MLIQFNFSNFKSYKEQVSLDMTATSIKEHPYNLITNAKKEQYLKVAAVYGANASGKTGIFEAFEFMRNFVIFSFMKESEKKGIPLKRFAFDKLTKNSKSEFEVFFIHRDKEYQYGFVVDNKKVYEEWLYKRDYRGKSRYNTLFERRNDKINCSRDLRDAYKFVDLVEESTLFLSLISNAKIREVKNVYEWFLNTEVINFGDTIIESYVSGLLPVEKLNDPKYKTNLEKFLKAIDMGIDGIRIEKIKNLVDEDDEPVYRVYAKHRMADSSDYVEISFSEESSGTKKMFCMYHFLVEVLEEGNTLLIDELSAKLHPLLLRYIINMFHNPDINKNNAQLIYSTHDIFTLTKDTFRRDQIWFVEKDNNGVSDLYSLVEYKLDSDKKVRNDATFNKDYLAGRYGAVPILKEFHLMEEK